MNLSHCSSMSDMVSQVMGNTTVVSTSCWGITGPLWLLVTGLVCCHTIRQIPRNTLGPRQNIRRFPDDIFKCIFLNENVWISINISFLRVQSTIFHHWFRLWLGAVQATSHYLNQWWLVYWRIYASLGLNELKKILIINENIYEVTH